ncbi:hypothetical protein [Methylomonas rapida]|uniref:DUF2232 domain-containing protein n=1 Tax=Methylomonas rapida TaxID=2963939 RepID=A0ABY7GMU2_9GAMM|nr:hypothetical protein [Methylomonas rapida]WAR45820.1 hypothetical protein NM686_004710 [Methylomonas rapida]
MQFLAAYIMKGRLQAMTVAAALALLSLAFPPASIVSSASVALVTLRRGAKEGLYVLLFSCLAAAVLSVFLKIGYQFALLYGLVLWMPIWLISIVLREGRHLGVAIEIAVLLGVVAVLGFYLYQPQPAQLWDGVLTTMMQPMLAARPDVPAEDVRHSAQVFAHFMTGAIAAGSVYSLLFGLFLARWWQAALYNPGGFRSEFLTLKSHAKLAMATIVIIAVATLASGVLAEVCWNVLLVLLVLYTFIGTAVLHACFAVMKGSRFMVPFLYLTLVVIPHVMVIIALCGLTDNWLDLRKKISNQTAE